MTIKGNKSNLDLVKELAKLIKESDLSEIEIEHSDENSGSIYVKVSRLRENNVPVLSNSPTAAPKIELAQEHMNNERKEPTSLSIENDPGTLLSPMVGTVYLAPEPNAEPFVKIGDKVKIGQTVIIVEAMKTLNQIPATKGGIIKRILVEDGTPVEFGSPLIVVE